MSVHSTFYQNEEDYKADLAWEYRTEQAGLYKHDDDEPEEPDCERCIHMKPLHYRGVELIYGCENWECEFEEKE